MFYFFSHFLYLILYLIYLKKLPKLYKLQAPDNLDLFLVTRESRPFFELFSLTKNGLYYLPSCDIK